MIEWVKSVEINSIAMTLTFGCIMQLFVSIKNNWDDYVYQFNFKGNITYDPSYSSIFVYILLINSAIFNYPEFFLINKYLSQNYAFFSLFLLL